MDNNDDSKKRKSIKKVVWDEEKLAECEHEKHLIPKTKIDEAKTPYVHPIEDSSDPYVLMLKEVEDTKCVDDINKALEHLSEKIHHLRKSSEDLEEEKKQRNKDLQKKAYSGEFLKAKQNMLNNIDDEDELENKSEEIDIIDEKEKTNLMETFNNTIHNKYIGKLTKDENVNYEGEIESEYKK